MSSKPDPIYHSVISRIGVTAFLCSVAYLLFTLVDPFIYPDFTANFLIYRLIAIGYVFSLLLIRRRFLEKHILPILYLSAFIVPLPTTLETFHTEGFASPYYVGLILIDVGGRLVYPVQAKRGLKISAIIFLPFVILGFIHGNFLPAQAIQSIFHIAVSTLVSAVGGELIYRLYVRQDQAERELKRLNNALAELSLRDPLTNAYNRRYMQQILSNQIALFRRHDTPFSLIIGDLDNFKAINDIYGHLIGDKVLAEVCDTLHREIRQEDLLFRFGGDEFALILPNTKSDFAGHLGERIRIRVRELKMHKLGISQSLTISMGIAQVQDNDTDQSLIKRADLALYLAKENGHDRIEMANGKNTLTIQPK